MCVPGNTVCSTAGELVALLQVSGVEAQITYTDAVPLSEELPVPRIDPNASIVCTVNGPLSPAPASSRSSWAAYIAKLFGAGGNDKAKLSNVEFEPVKPDSSA